MRATIQPQDVEDDDPEVALAIQESIELMEESELQQALEASRAHMPSTPKAGSSSKILLNLNETDDAAVLQHEDIYGSLDSEDEYDLDVQPTRLETALSIANAGPSRSSFPLSNLQPRSLFAPPISSAFGDPSSLLPSEPSTSAPSEPSEKVVNSDDDMEEVPVQPSSLDPSPDLKSVPAELPQFKELATPKPPLREELAPSPFDTAQLESDDEMEEVTPARRIDLEPILADSAHEASPTLSGSESHSRHLTSLSPLVRPLSLTTSQNRIDTAPARDDSPIEEHNDVRTHKEKSTEVGSSDVEPSSPWSTSVSPRNARLSLPPDQEHEGEDWDAAQEMDPQAEEGEFARFISQVRGKDIDEVRNEIEEEIRVLNEQKKIAMRDSEDVTQQMISQIMVHFLFILFLKSI